MNCTIDPTWARSRENVQEQRFFQSQHRLLQQSQKQPNEQTFCSVGERKSPPKRMAVSVAADEFADFLDLGDIDLKFPLQDGLSGLPATSLSNNADAPSGVHEEESQLNMAVDNSELEMYAQKRFFSVDQHNPLYDSFLEPSQPKYVPELFNSHRLTSAPQPTTFETQHENQRKEEQRHQLQFGSFNDRRFPLPNAIPPTPASLEMRPIHHGYTPHTDANSIFPADSSYFINAEDTQFTPLVSPAVTPLDINFDFTTKYALPSTSFSPLASPALESQMFRHSYPHHEYTTDNSAATSPLDIDMDSMPYTVRPEVDVSRKIRKRTPTPRSVSTIPTGAASPSTRPQRRKGTFRTSLPLQDALKLQENGPPPHSLSQRAAGILAPTSRESSDGDPNSPESLSDGLMGPPPKSTSVNNSPTIVGQQRRPEQLPQLQVFGQSPATPASLMRIPSDQTKPTTKKAKLVSANNLREARATEDLGLSDATTSRGSSKSSRNPASASSETSRDEPYKLVEDSGVSLRQTAVPSALATSTAVKSSPQSPLTAETPKAGEPAMRSGRKLKKRNGTGSKTTSPALWPKISPSIKPLLPEGATLSENAHTLLLASKSNYQNILDGTRIPGVHYSETLSNNLSSKRASHKIAEQGRRNRINTALQEMQSLLPTPPPSQPSSASIPAMKLAKESAKATNGSSSIGITFNCTDQMNRGSSEDDDRGSHGSQKNQSARKDMNIESPVIPAANETSNSSTSASMTTPQQQNSKAATIESAIDYIKTLQREAHERDRLLKIREGEMQELKSRLEQVEGKEVVKLKPDNMNEMMEVSDCENEKEGMARNGKEVEMT